MEAAISNFQDNSCSFPKHGRDHISFHRIAKVQAGRFLDFRKPRVQVFIDDQIGTKRRKAVALFRMVQLQFLA